jgi:type I restriction enzyme S subunit
MPDPLGRACIFPGEARRCVTVVDVCILRSGTAQVNHRWLMYAINSPDFRISVAALQSGSTRKRISRGNLATLQVPVPPLPEQRRIVAEIETQFARLEAGVAALKRVQANLKRYRAAVLRAACEGRLVPVEAELARAEGRDYEPADQLVARSLAEQRARWEAYRPGKAQVQGGTLRAGRRMADCPDPVKPDVTDLPEIPDGWVWTTVGGMLAEPICNGISVKGAEEPPGVPSLKLNAMSERGFNYELVRFLPLAATQVAGLHVLPGDFFVSRGNGSLAFVGRGTVAQTPPFPVIFPDLMMRLRLLPGARASNWLPTIWPSAVVRRQIERKAKTTAGIWKVAQPDVASVVVPLPPLAEQQRIVAEVERRLSTVDEIEVIVAANLKRAERLRQAILKRAFEGKLVPQDSSDEPASVLLERIRAEREASGKARGNGRGSGRGKEREPSLDLGV